MRDPGLQPERTALAWRRTAVAAAGVALVCSVTSVRAGVISVALVAALVAGGIVIASLFGPVRHRMSSTGGGGGGRGRGHGDRPWPALVLLVVCVCVVAMLGCALAVIGAAQR